jgi:hypothetical protein
MLTPASVSPEAASDTFPDMLVCAYDTVEEIKKVQHAANITLKKFFIEFSYCWF